MAVAEQWIHGGLIAAAAQMAAEDARRSALPFARALVALKREWSHLPELRQLPITDAQDLLDQLVTASIRAYYALGAGTVDAARAEASGEASGDAAAVVPAAGGARERSASVARMLLDVIHTYVPDDRLAGEARPLDGVPPSSAPTDADLEARLLRALDGLSPTEAAALTDGLQHLHAELGARRWPRAAARGGASLPFRRPTR